MLLSDYIDGEIDQETRKSVEEHLADCVDCKRLVTMVKEDMSIISGDAAKEKAPSHLWHSITKKIMHEKKAGTVAIDFVRDLAERLMPPRLAPALVGIALLTLSTSFFLYTQYLRGGYGNGSIDYVSEVLTNAGFSAVTEHEGLGTPIEEYFL